MGQSLQKIQFLTYFWDRKYLNGKSKNSNSTGFGLILLCTFKPNIKISEKDWGSLSDLKKVEGQQRTTIDDGISSDYVSSGAKNGIYRLLFTHVTTLIHSEQQIPSIYQFRLSGYGYWQKPGCIIYTDQFHQSFIPSLYKHIEQALFDGTQISGLIISPLMTSSWPPEFPIKGTVWLTPCRTTAFDTQL